MMTRWILAAAAACTAIVTPAMAQQSEDAKAVLAESAKAMQSVPAVTFHGKKYGTGMLKDIIDCEGDVKLWHSGPGKPATMMVTGRIKQPAAQDKMLTYMQDGTIAQWLEQKSNEMYERGMMDSLALQEFNLAKQICPEDYFAPQPFAQVLRMEKLTKLPNDNFKGEVCEVIQGSTADGSRTITWKISVTDRLPRAMEMATGTDDKKIAMIHEMTNFNTNAKLSAADFKVEMPTGYVLNKMTNAPKLNPGANPNDPAQPQVELGLKPGVDAPAFSMKSAEGKDVSLAGMKGDVVVLEFFGTMFKASVIGSASIQTMQDDFKGKNVKFVGMACRERDAKAAKEYFAQNGLTYTLVPNADAAVTDYNVKGFPSYYVISPDGKVAAFFQNFPGRDVMASAINQAMQTK